MPPMRVESIDRVKRILVASSRDALTIEMTIAPGVRNLEDVHAGDQIRPKVRENLTVYVAPQPERVDGGMTGDPRASRGNGGAVINYVTHSLSPTIEPVANLCASGVLERFPKLRFATVEAGIGWVPWLLDAMDEAYRKHHMWVRPKLQGLPSDYYRAHGFATFQEDPSGLFLAERHGLTDNFMWANDYPHHEGTWPHSAEAIERTMPMLDETQRAKILGLNAARFFKLAVPAHQRLAVAE